MKKIIKLIKENYDIKKKYKKDQIIFNEGDLCKYIGLVVEGNIIIASYTYSGKEIIFNKCDEGKIFGHTLIFSSLPYYKGSVISNNNSTILFINKNKLLNELIKENLLDELLKIISDDVLNAKEQSRLLAFDKTKDRLLYLLYKKNELHINSITELAKEINVSRETLSKTIKELINNKTITYENKIIKIVNKN